MSHRIQATASIKSLFHEYKQTHLPAVCKYIMTVIIKFACKYIMTVIMKLRGELSYGCELARQSGRLSSLTGEDVCAPFARSKGRG